MKNKNTLLLLFLFCCFRNVSAQSITFPAQVLDLTNWKVTLPVETAHAGSPDEIKQTELATFKDDEYFHVNAAGDGVVFKAHAGGATTSGSGYPRSELREMITNGTQNANWSSSDGNYHVLYADVKINHLPDVKKHVVVGQIHDASTDVLMIRLENTKLFVEYDGTDGPTLIANYVLGTRFTYKIETYQDQTKIYVNGGLVTTYPKTFSGAYFKAGMYTQSSCTTIANEPCSAYGESEFFGLSVFHGPSLPASLSPSLEYFKDVKITYADEMIHFFNLPESKDVESVHLYDIQGKLLNNFVVNKSSDKIPVGNLNHGLYIVEVLIDGKKFTRKINVVGQ